MCDIERIGYMMPAHDGECELSKDVVISFYDLTGKFVQPWADAGYECYCVDIQHPKGETNPRENITFIGADMTDFRIPKNIIDRIVFASSFSPCDDASVSGARWFKGKGLYALAKSVELFAIGRDWINWLEVPGFCEHPVSTISTYYRKSDYRFDPADYTGYCENDHYTKQTHIWGYNGFVMPPKNKGFFLTQPDNRIHMAVPGPDRKNFRSATPMGFAKATFLANRNGI